MTWRMTMWTGSDRLIEINFTSVVHWEAWLRANHPALMKRDTWTSLDAEDRKQRGTNDYWSCIERVSA